MDADATLGRVHSRLAGVLKITTNLMTTEGRRIAVSWHHEDPDGKRTPCLVIGVSIDEALRKVLDLEEDFEYQFKSMHPPR